ncbi:hypothetical protein C6496_06000 [Candidatus Poribacteria bacterium]|nr:MAG: hypothetical protein C6496_06000 [Candidatus Poribacteria bacterium]
MKRVFSYAALFCAMMFIAVGYATADLAEGLVLYFTFDNVNGKTIVDDSGNGLDADVIANTDFVDGKYGKAIHITALGMDCVNVPASDELKISGELNPLQPKGWRFLLLLIATFSGFKPEQQVHQNI